MLSFPSNAQNTLDTLILRVPLNVKTFIYYSPGDILGLQTNTLDEEYNISFFMDSVRILNHNGIFRYYKIKKSFLCENNMTEEFTVENIAKFKFAYRIEKINDGIYQWQFFMEDNEDFTFRNLYHIDYIKIKNIKFLEV